jgi:hypothetical protein
VSWRWRSQRKIAKLQEEIQQLEQKSPMMTLACSKGIILG